MPDWSYHPIFKPLLFRMGATRSRDLTLAAIGRLGRLPGGSLLIRTLGHLEAYPEVRVRRLGLDFASPVYLPGEVDPHGAALPALAQLGFGCLEVGPVTETPAERPPTLTRDAANETIVTSNRYASDGVDAIARRLAADRGRLRGRPVFARTRHEAGASPEAAADAHRRLAERLAEDAAAFVVDGVDERWTPAEQAAFFDEAAAKLRAAYPDRPLLLYVPPDLPADALEAAAKAAKTRFDGVVVGDAIRAPDGWRSGRPAMAAVEATTRALRRRLPEPFAIVASGGVHEPADALRLREAGADLVGLYAGFVFGGPGLPKRVNDALLYEAVRPRPAPPEAPFWKAWGWMTLLGLAMIVGGSVAWLIAATSVVLPYDEAFLGAGRDAIDSVNEKLLPFMSHDRISLAGTMISIGILYAFLARYGLRRKLHWARTALLTSGIVGFSGFFLYLGYGYFDPLHAAVSAALLPMFVLAMRDASELPPRDPPNLRNDAAWRRSLLGQLAFVAAGVGLAAGGVAIAGIGVTHVFVSSDLAFLGTHAEHLRESNANLVPLIAHDRAGFGGALLSDALAILVTALWGIRQGERWIWRMLLLAGLPGFAAGLGVHAAIGYVDFLHLLPVYVLLALYIAGLVLLYPYLHRAPEEKSEAVSPPSPQTPTAP
ncbi:hypothetical protein MO973_02705 [Paenibacillus sp. TRM 82003]|nr:hypothetical protein [Paenibacillus sp. TRM 82003]